MSEEHSYYREAVKTAREVKNKYDYFFLGVTLAVLSISIQGFNPTSKTSYNYLILISWLALIISFLSGMYQQQRLYMFLKVEADKIYHLPSLSNWERGKTGELIYKPSGETLSVDEIKKAYDNTHSLLEIADQYLQKYARHANNAYEIQKWSFLIGLILMASFKFLNI